MSRVESHAQLRVQRNLHAKEIHRIADFFNAAQNDAGHRQRLVGIYHKGKGLWVEAGQEEGSVVRLLQGDGAGYILDHCVVVFGGQFQYAVGVAVAQGLGDRIQVVQMDDDHAEAFAALAPDQFVQAHFIAAAVRQTGERMMQGLVHQP